MWKSVRLTWAQVGGLLEIIGAEMMLFAAQGDRTSFTIYTERTDDLDYAEVIFNPEASVLFFRRLQEMGAVEAAPPTPDASVLVNVEWPPLA
jgi:hypothetical protein